MSSIASNHCLSSLCYRRIQHTDNLPLIIGIGVGIPVCLLLLVIIVSIFSMLQEDSSYRQFTTDYRNWCWNSSMSSIASNHCLSSLCYRRLHHTAI